MIPLKIRVFSILIPLRKSVIFTLIFIGKEVAVTDESFSELEFYIGI